MSKNSSLFELQEKSGTGFPNLFSAREKTSLGLSKNGELIGASDIDVSVVLMGSWGRAEVTSGSDDDFMILVDGSERDSTEPSKEAIAKVFDQEPGSQGIFGGVVGSSKLINNIGLDQDDVNNLTRRMLLVLESIPVSNSEVHSKVKSDLLSRYLDQSKDYRPPRFLLNDIVRYWRTICVDFAGKEQESPDKWGIRNAKLRTYRKVLFAGGLLPVLRCYSLLSSEMFGFLESEFRMPPTDRLARSFLTHDLIDAGARSLGAYDEFIGLMEDKEFRTALAETTRENKETSEAFQRSRTIGQELEAGLLALLFETDLREVVREYAIF